MTRTLRAVAGAPFAKRSWLATMQLMTGLVVAIITLTVMLFLTAVGAAVLPTVVLTAVPFVALLACADVFTAWQRSRLAAFDGIRIPDSPGVLPRGLGPGGSLLSDLAKAARRLSTWRHIGYHLIVGPAITIIGGGITVLAWSAALVLATHPLQIVVLPAVSGRNPPKVAAATVLGLLVLFIAPWIARAAARIDTATAALMLGPDRAAELERLEQSRAATISAADTERRRIERDLHDGAQQRLVSIAMRLGLARATLEEVPPEAMRVIERAHEDVKEAIRELRDLVQGMHPAILTDRGLDAALSGIAARASLPVKLTVNLPQRELPTATEAVAFFIVSEALANIAKHASASEAMVTVTHNERTLTVTISDDGHGGANPDGGTGLRGLAQRAASVDGTLHIDSPPGGPTVITAELPCASLSPKTRSCSGPAWSRSSRSSASRSPPRHRTPTPCSRPSWNTNRTW